MLSIMPGNVIEVSRKDIWDYSFYTGRLVGHLSCHRQWFRKAVNHMTCKTLPEVMKEVLQIAVDSSGVARGGHNHIFAFCTNNFF